MSRRSNISRIDKKPGARELARQRMESLLQEAGIQSAPRPFVGRACDGKTKFSERLARIVAERIRENEGEDIQPYACLWCSAWHIGHPARVALATVEGDGRGPRAGT